MIDVDDFAKVVWPVGAVEATLSSQSRPGGAISARKHRRDRGEEIAPVKAGRKPLRPPLDLEGSRGQRATADELEEAVAGADVAPAIGLEDNRRARAADAGIDDAKKDGAFGKPHGIGRQQIGRSLWIAGRRVGEEVDDGRARRHAAITAFICPA